MMARRPIDDLRWQRTEDSLMNAFLEELEERPLKKITVASLVRKARINKSTFYLHYSDIYDLGESYTRKLADELIAELDCLNLFFDKPGEFARRFVAAVSDPARKPHSRILKENELVPTFLARLIADMFEEVKDAAPGGTTVEELSVQLTFVMTGLMSTLQFQPSLDSDALIGALEPIVQSVNTAMRKA